MEDVCGWVRLIPALRKPGLDFVVLISFHQRIEDEHVEPFRLHIDADAGIEVDGAGLDEGNGGVGVGFSAASVEQGGRGHCENDTEKVTSSAAMEEKQIPPLRGFAASVGMTDPGRCLRHT